MNDKPSPDLQKLINAVRDKLVDKKSPIEDIVSSLEDLLSFLVSSEGRTDANCQSTDTYFCLHRDHGFSWDHLPKKLQLILADIGGQLHDTIMSPKMAINFDSTPEQLLARIWRFKNKYKAG